MRLSLLPITVAALVLAACPALAQSPGGLPTDRNAPAYLLTYWRSHGPGSTLGLNASETSPGHYEAAPAVYVHNIYGAKIPPAQADLLKRRLLVAYKALMAQPSLADIHGSSLQAAINVTRTPTDDGEPIINASLTFIAKPITKDDPKTLAIKGRYVTPGGEGPVLEVVLNPYAYVSANLQPGPASGRTLALSGGTRLLVTDQPAGRWEGAAVEKALAVDESWVGGPGVHPLMIRMAGSRPRHQEIASGRAPATDPLARLIAAAYMVDWEAVQAQMKAVR